MAPQRVVLAEYFATDDSTLLFIVRSDFDEPYVAEIKRPLKEIQQFVVDRFRKDVQNLNVEEYQSFFQPFVDPLVDKLPGGDPMTSKDDIIWFVPHDALHYLPLHALTLEGQCLIERNPVCYTPSASVMKYCHAKRKGRRAKALVLGDSRNNLAHARQEAIAVANLFGTVPYLKEQATKSFVTEKLRQEREEIDILHFACHGYFDPLQPLRSGIELAPEQEDSSSDADNLRWNLTAEEIFGLEMRADLVTLSACETGVNDRRPGDELIGLTRALIYAGTPSVVVSLWRVNSLAAQICMEQFYKALQGGMLKVTALQQAQVDLMNMHYGEVRAYVSQRQAMLEAQYPHEAAKLIQELHLALLGLEANQPVDAEEDDWRPFTHLYHWAPFALVGDWK